MAAGPESPAKIASADEAPIAALAPRAHAAHARAKRSAALCDVRRHVMTVLIA